MTRVPTALSRRGSRPHQQPYRRRLPRQVLLAFSLPLKSGYLSCNRKRHRQRARSSSKKNTPSARRLCARCSSTSGCRSCQALSTPQWKIWRELSPAREEVVPPSSAVARSATSRRRQRDLGGQGTAVEIKRPEVGLDIMERESALPGGTNGGSGTSRSTRRRRGASSRWCDAPRLCTARRSLPLQGGCKGVLSMVVPRRSGCVFCILVGYLRCLRLQVRCGLIACETCTYLLQKSGCSMCLMSTNGLTLFCLSQISDFPVHDGPVFFSPRWS